MTEMFPTLLALPVWARRPKAAGTRFKEPRCDSLLSSWLPVFPDDVCYAVVGLLMDTLAKSNPHYINCIKPNSVKKANVFEDALNMHQVPHP